MYKYLAHMQNLDYNPSLIHIIQVTDNELVVHEPVYMHARISGPTQLRKI